VYSMIRTQILLDKLTYEALRRAAAAQDKAISALVREVLARSLGTEPTPGRRRRYGWTFVGMARGTTSDVSRRHDDYLSEGKRW